MPYFMGTLALREQVREALARVVAVDPEHVALTTSTTDGCNIVLGGLELGAGDEIVTTTEEHFGLLGPLARLDGHRRRRRARSGVDHRCGNASHPPARALTGPLDDRPRPAGA